MIENYEKAKSILEEYHQEHLLNFYEELNTDEQQALIDQICRINFKQIFDLYEASKIDEIIPHNLIEPLPYNVKNQLSDRDLSFYSEIGNKMIIKK